MIDSPFAILILHMVNHNIKQLIVLASHCVLLSHFKIKNELF